MRLLLLSVIIALLAGCRLPSSDASASVNQPSETSVEADLANEQDAVADAITNDAAADARNESGNDDTTDDETPDRFSCDKGMIVQVEYGTDDGTARLTIAGKTMALLAANGASGGSYKTDDGLMPGESLTWSATGTTATLVQAPHNAQKGSPAQTVSRCQAMD